MSASLANERRARPNVFGSSTMDILVPLAALKGPPYTDGGCRNLNPRGDDVADHDRSCSAWIDSRELRRHLIQCPAPGLLFRSPRVDDHRHWRPAGPAGIDERARDRRGPPKSHQHDE